MSRYEIIDPTLSDWATKNSVRWYSEYQDTEVRTFYVQPERKDRIQVSVDAYALRSCDTLPRGLL
jgi:hypothetical protein